MNRSRTFLKSLAVALFFGASLAFGSHAFAQVVDPSSGLESFGEAAGFVTTGSLTLTIARLIRTAITFLGILAVTFVLYGGFLFMTAGGNDDKVKRAKKVFTSAIIGLVIILSAFTIVQFVLGQLGSALGGGVTTDGGDGDGGYVDGDGGGTTGTFELTAVNTECAAAIQNLQLQFTFSQRVSSSTVDAGGIVVYASDDTPVDGTLSVSGRNVTFTPAKECDGYPGEYCFESGSTYSVVVDDSILKSSGGIDLTCGTECTFDFTAGTAVDTEGPTMTMDSPEDEATVYVNDIQDLQTHAVDDTGVSSAEFTVDGETVYQAALSTDSTGGALSPDNYFHIADGTEWDTAGYADGTYTIRAEGSDCAGHSDTSNSITVVLRPAHCGNDVADEDDPDTSVDESDTADNCGGDECGACDGSACTTDADCSSGYCDPTTLTCAGVPQIEAVSPGDGADFNLITVGGSNFGTTAGTVTFLGDTTTTSDDLSVSAYECNGSTQWGDEQIVVQVPTGAVDGPIQVTTSDAYSDQTDDDYGPSISDFDVNGIVRPGLCSLEPASGEAFSTVTLSGLKLGDDQGTSTVYFSNTEAYDYSAWGDEEISVLLPLLNARDYQTQVWSGDYECLDVDGTTTGDYCAEDSDCVALGFVSCHTMQCSGTLEDCAEDSDCSDGESCVSVRQGSNELTFTVTDPDTGAAPVISSTDSGWEACSDGTHCGEDTDCSSGTCDAADNWGPPGQYVTIYGSDFGTATGTVHFTDDLGYANGVIDDFPDACGTDFWDDTQITIKVPSAYTNIDSDGDGEGDDIASFGTFTLTVETADGEESDGMDFVIRDDEPGPGICAIDPVSGPAGVATVTVTGDNFDSQGSGTVEFFNGRAVSSVDYWNETGILVLAPSTTESGPVFVTADSGFDSNSQNFEVSDCSGDDANCSVTGTTCCADGSCSVLCEETIPSSHYAWMFSTADIPATPRVLVYCGDRDDDGSYDGVSPGPSNSWSQPADICVNAGVTATFDQDMLVSSFTGNVHVTTGGVEVDGSIVPTATAASSTFQWIPTDNGGEFLPGTTYTVTLDSAGILSSAGALMARDYEWEFTTASSGDPCVIGSVYTSPSTFTAVTENEQVGYLAQPISAEDECVPLVCTGYAWDWESSDTGDATVSPDSSSTSCATTATALQETFGTPVDIRATATNPDGADPYDEGELTINFTDPEVSSWAPSCETACVNGGIDATFNTDMEDSFVAGTNVTLYECEDSLCDTVSEGSEFSGTYGVTYTSSTRSLNISHDVFDASTWYRVVIDGNVTSTSGVELSESGSNYATSDNLYYSDDFSWIFKTKSTDEPCAVDRVEVSPSSATDTYIGQQNLWEAIPYGAPDDCSASGQELDASGYDWSAWDATDNPDVHTDDLRDVAGMLPYTSETYTGMIELTSQLENGCSSDCLNIGSAASTDDAVCGNGSIEYGEECDGGTGCSSDCLNEGSTQCTYSCDTSGASCVSDVTCAETCDAATGFCTTNTSVACAADSDCPYDGGTCVQATGCCGDGTKDADEECDDGNSSNNDGCSSICLNNGARRALTTCGGPTIDQSPVTGGEDCDDGNTANGDGCSSDCLYEGGVAEDGIYATCGNGGAPEDGEDCDDGNTDDEDGCSSDCLYEGASACSFVCVGGIDAGDGCSGTGAVTCDLTASGDALGTCSAAVSPCCGDGDVDYSAVSGAWSDQAEDCDDGNTTDGDGCSSICLSEGSNENYSATVGGASYCGDGVVSTNTDGGGEECDAASGYTFDVTNRGVSVIKDAAAQEVLNGRAGATILASVSSPEVEGSAELTLTCSCELDSACGDSSAYGCGTGSCCFVRPEEDSRYPNDGDESVCLNTSVYVDFTDTMDADALDPEDAFPAMYLELTYLDGGSTSVTQTNCPYSGGWIQVAQGNAAPSSWIARALDWISTSVRRLFGQSASAETYACVVPVRFSVSANAVGGSRVAMAFDEALEEDATYAFTVVKDADETDASPDGVLSVNGVSVALTDSTNGETTTFETGDQICTLDVVRVEDLGTVASLIDELADPSVGYFTNDGETHQLEAAAYTVNGGSLDPISETASYGWSWVWGTSVSDLDTESDIVSVTSSDVTTLVATAAGLTGRETAEAQANFNATNTFGDTTGGVNGSVALTANICDNPPTVGFPYTDSTGSSASNFSFFYCKDAGVAGDITDDLPELDLPVDVTSYTTDIIQELIFPVSGSSDAIGVRVLKNSAYLSPSAWYDEQGFTGSPTSVTVDGYEAVKDGNTVYVVAANYSSSASRLYSNVYVISYTEDADAESQEIFDQILANWTFNSNTTYVTDVNLCVSSDGSYPTAPYECTSSAGVSNGVSCTGSADTTTCGTGLTCQSAGFVSCEWDGDCADVGTDATCDAEKAKLTRDTKRLSDMTDSIALVNAYSELNGSCSVTADQACTDDSQCPGDETCNPGTPTLQTGTFVSPYSISAWPSWSAALGNELGEALPEDPLNAFYQCENVCDAGACALTGDACSSDADCSSYESDTCWNATSATFTCPSGSHVYGYKSSGGIAYALYAQLEFGDARWGVAIEPTGSFDTMYISQPYTGSGTPSNGFVRATADPLCLGSIIGSAAICGDGIVGAGEDCEIGDTTSLDCASSGGTITVTCKAGCVSGYQSQTEAEADGAACVPYDCGNGVTEASNGETCDDGSLNGTYGHCGADCTTDTAYSCGDGYLAGGEQCDCGETSNYHDLVYDGGTDTDFDVASWTYINNCQVSNGQWQNNPSGTCSWDCQYPGPSCGDGELNGSEVCDGDYDTWAGALCYGGDDDGEACSADSECDSGQCGSTSFSCEQASTVTCTGTSDTTSCGSWGTCEDAGTTSDSYGCGLVTTTVCTGVDDASCTRGNTCIQDSTGAFFCGTVSGSATCSAFGDDCSAMSSSAECVYLGESEDYECQMSGTTSCTGTTDTTSCGSWGTCVGTSDYAACSTSSVCVGGSDEGEACTSGSTCDSGSCSSFTYDLERTRTCQSSCDWDTSTPGGWTECMGGSQVCGNGTAEGDEECDDGNTDDTDACTASCLLNVCGDGSVYSGVESCDSGDRNGEECDAPYEGTCNYCTSSCQYKTSSGAYCGDGIDNGTEFCDGADIPYYCFDNASGVADRSDTCSTEGSTSECDSGYTCRWLGTCNGGSKQGQACSLNPADGSTYSTDESADKNGCGSDGSCIAPTCADDCSSMCPFAYETASVQAQTEESGASPEDSVDLYSYNSGFSPDNATFFIPACSVATSLTADVDTSGVTAPDVDIVFLTDYTLTMGYWVDGAFHCYGDGDSTAGTDCVDATDSANACGTGTCSKYAPVGSRRIDYTVDATVDAVSTIFSQLEARGATVRGSSTLFYDGVSGSVPSGTNYAGEDGYYTYPSMSVSNDTTLESIIGAYTTGTLQTWTPHYKGLAGALAQFSTSTADTKIVVMLSDGLPTHDKNGATCASTSACIQEIVEDLLPTIDDDTKVFTAAITNSSSSKAYMAHISSDDCGTSYSSLSDCDPDENNVEYAYQAEDEEGIATMYASIVSSILGVTVGVTSDFTGASTTDIGTVTDGSGQVLPFPTEFECDGADMSIPFTVSFNGNGYMTLSNIEVTYCPAL